MTPDAGRAPGEAAAAPGAEALAGVVGMRVRRLQTLIAGHWARWFEPLGLRITPVQGGILLLVADNPGLRQTELARLLRIEAPTLSQALAPLVRGGMLARRRAAADRRAVALTLTEAGAAAVAVLREQALAHEADALSALSPEERTELLRLLDKALASR